MSVRSRRTAYYLALVVATTLLFTTVYNVGMAVWEGSPQPIYRSLEVVVQSFTTTGYGEDAGWQTPQMNLLVIAMQFAGIGLILTAVDVFAVPWLREAVTPSAPTTAPDCEDHVVVCGHTSRTDAFVDELEERDRTYLLVEPDEEVALALDQDDYQVVCGDPTDADALERAGLASATALVADVSDEANASIAISAREVAPSVQVVTLVEDADLARYHRAAGADDVLSPRQLLGERLAAEVPTSVTTTVADDVVIGEDIELLELSIGEDASLAGQTLAEAALRERFGVGVVGAWVDGTFRSPVGADCELGAGDRLLVAGTVSQTDDLRETLTAPAQPFSAQDVILAGYGDGGQAAYHTLARAGSRLTVLDLEPSDVVDVVGDARDPDVLEQAGIADASVLVVTVSDDTTAIFATLIARELNPDLRIVVRANEDDDVEKLSRAGADYVQSLATVSGRMLASTVFGDEAVLPYGEHVRVVRLPAPGLVGRSIDEADVRAETGSTVVAVVRNGEIRTEFDAAPRVQADDEVVVAGTDEAVADFERQYGG